MSAPTRNNPELTRQIKTLREVDRLSWTEIGRRTGVSDKSAKKYYVESSPDTIYSERYNARQEIKLLEKEIKELIEDDSSRCRTFESDFDGFSPPSLLLDLKNYILNDLAACKDFQRHRFHPFLMMAKHCLGSRQIELSLYEQVYRKSELYCKLVRSARKRQRKVQRLGEYYDKINRKKVLIIEGADIFDEPTIDLDSELKSAKQKADKEKEAYLHAKEGYKLCSSFFSIETEPHRIISYFDSRLPWCSNLEQYAEWNAKKRLKSKQRVCDMDFIDYEITDYVYTKASKPTEYDKATYKVLFKSSHSNETHSFEVYHISHPHGVTEFLESRGVLPLPGICFQTHAI